MAAPAIGALLKRLAASVIGRTAVKQAAVGVTKAGAEVVAAKAAQSAALRLGAGAAETAARTGAAAPFVIEGTDGVAANARALTQALARPVTKPEALPAAQPQRQTTNVVERFRNWARQRAERAAERKALETPVSEQIRGLTWGQRMERLKAKGELLAKGEVARQMLRPEAEITPRDIVAASEQAQEVRRQKRLGELETTGGAVKKSLMVGALAPVGAVIALKKFADVVEGITSRLMERQRDLAEYDPRIAGVMARTELHQMQLDIQTARATAHSTEQMAIQLKQLRDELQPIKEATITIKNNVASVLCYAANKIVELLKKVPGIAGALEQIEAAEKAQQAKQQSEWERFINAIFEGNFGPDGAERAENRARRAEGRRRHEKRWHIENE